MALGKIIKVDGQGVYVPGSDLDTDRIIPARFMKVVTFDGLGEFAFYDVRHDASGQEIPHPMNDKRFKSANILLSGVNFGCGSSREHAPQALYRYGFRGIIAESFAEIFFGNSTTLGLPCVTATGEDIRALAAAVENNPQLDIAIDLEKLEVRYANTNSAGTSFKVAMPETARSALVAGRWDPIADLLEGDANITITANNLPYMKT